MGGFDIEFNIDDFKNKVTNVNSQTAYFIQWNDFGNNYSYMNGIRKCNENNPCSRLDSEYVKKFGADFIIRGHQDTLASSLLLIDKDTHIDGYEYFVAQLQQKYNIYKDESFLYLPYVKIDGKNIISYCNYEMKCIMDLYTE